MDRRVLKPRLDHHRAADAFGLRRAKGRLLEDAPQRAVHRHSHEGDDLRSKALDLLLEDLPALLVLHGTQIVDARARPRDQVGHADAPLRQPDVVLVRDRLGDDAGFVEQAPEPVGRSGEVMAQRRRHYAGIDADEDQAHARLNRVGQSTIGPGGLRIGGHELVV